MEALVEILLKNFDVSAMQSMESIASLVDAAMEDEVCILTKIYDTNIEASSNDLFRMTKKEVVAACTVCEKEECTPIGFIDCDTDCPLYVQCEETRKFLAENKIILNDHLLHALQQNKFTDGMHLTETHFRKLQSMFPWFKKHYKIEIIMSSKKGFGYLALFSALDILTKDLDTDATVFLSTWKKSKIDLKSYYKKLGFASYNSEFGKMSISSVHELLKNLAQKEFPDAFIEIKEDEDTNIHVYKRMPSEIRSSKRIRITSSPVESI